MTIPGPQPLSDDAVAKKLAEFDSVPLFMKSAPSEERDDTVLAALQSLVHEGTPNGQRNHIFIGSEQKLSEMPRDRSEL